LITFERPAGTFVRAYEPWPQATTVPACGPLGGVTVALGLATAAVGVAVGVTVGVAVAVGTLEAVAPAPEDGVGVAPVPAQAAIVASSPPMRTVLMILGRTVAYATI
jgi:hypothetical protein